MPERPPDSPSGAERPRRAETAVFAIPGLLLLLVVDYFKPQEYLPVLQGFPFLYAFTALTVIGFAIDLRLGYARLRAAPHLLATLAFAAWCLVTALPLGGPIVMQQASKLLVPISLYLLVAHVIQGFRALQVVMGVVLAFGLAVAFVGAHQGVAPWGCHAVSYEQGRPVFVYDGRACSEEDRTVCNRDGAEPGVEYRCERVGLLGTQTVSGRVRFRGTMNDPNELALAVGIIAPIAIAFHARRRSRGSLALLVATLVLSGACAIFTRSRGGQLVFLASLGVYFVQRYRWRGLAVAAVVALPILVLGGRDRGDAAASTIERLECWRAGAGMFFGSPLLGVGVGQFAENHFLTAHNSLILVAAELGLPGMLLWCAVVYLCFKIPIEVLRQRESAGIADPVAPSWAVALLASMAGMLVGALFLSYAYKEVLWIYIGLTGGLYQAVKRHAPAFAVRFGARDAARVAVLGTALFLAYVTYTRAKLGY